MQILTTALHTNHMHTFEDCFVLQAKRSDSLDVLMQTQIRNPTNTGEESKKFSKCFKTKFNVFVLVITSRLRKSECDKNSLYILALLHYAE